MRHARIRARRPLGRRRRRELIILAERDIMTVDQAKKFFQEEREKANAFMDAEHVIRCWCENEVTTTIIRACELGWIVTSKNNQITLAACPEHSSFAREKLEADVESWRKRN